MPAIYLTEHGARLSVDNRRLQIEVEGGETVVVPVEQMSEVVALANVSISMPALKLLLSAGIDLTLLTEHGEYCGRLVGPVTAHARLRVLQYQRVNEPGFGLALARAIVRAKLIHQRTLLQRHQRRGNAVLATEIDGIAGSIARLEAMPDRAGLMGLEGAAGQAYFRGLRSLIDPIWCFEKRKRRPPPDPVNALLSFGYTLLANAAHGAVAAAGLDPYLGFLHAIDYNRPSLAVDVMEEFRPVVDGVVLWLVNGGQITPADFEPGNEERPCRMGAKAKRKLIEAYERRLEDEILHPTLGQRLSLRRCLLAQARQISDAVLNGQALYQPIGWR